MQAENIKTSFFVHGFVIIEHFVSCQSNEMDEQNKIVRDKSIEVNNKNISYQICQRLTMLNFGGEYFTIKQHS